jgi:hypothetical protein
LVPSDFGKIQIGEDLTDGAEIECFGFLAISPVAFDRFSNQ